jgi:type IV pilus assembly protein PilA
MKRALLLSLLVLVGACNKLKPKSSQESLLDFVPEKALAAVVIRADALKLFRQQLDEDPELQKELREYLVKREGLDLTRVSAVVAFITAPDAKDGAVVLRMPVEGTPTWDKVGDADGVALYKVVGPVVAATVPTGLILGTEAGVRAALATAQKKAPALGKQSLLAPMLEADASAQLVVAGSVDAISDAGAKAAAGLYGVKAVSAGYQPGKIYVWADGEVAGLKAARDAAKGFIDLGLQKAKEEKDKAMIGGSTVEGVSTIIGYRSYQKLAPKVTPRLEGNRLIVDYALPTEGDATTTMMMATATAGILAAIAIPAFLKYIKRSKTVEATMNVRKLYDATVGYYEEKHAFPAATEWTPARGCCGQPNDKCAPDPEAFSGPTWRALGFSIEDPHHYQYRFRRTEGGFVVEARGDLDCDGKFSSFRREGRVEPGGTISGGAGLETENDIE